MVRGEEMKKPNEPKLTASFVTDLQAKWEERGKEILDKLCDKAPVKLVEALAKLAVAERLQPEPTINFKEAKSLHDIAERLLQSCGFREPDEDSIQQAMEANKVFVDRLNAIVACAQATPEGEVH
jgi:hypothetical protein